MEPNLITIVEEMLDELEEQMDDVVPICVLCCNLGHYYAVDQVVICPCVNQCHASKYQCHASKYTNR